MLNLLNRIELFFFALSLKRGREKTSRSIDVFRKIIDDLKRQNKDHQMQRLSVLKSVDNHEAHLVKLNDVINGINDRMEQNDNVIRKMEDLFI